MRIQLLFFAACPHVEAARTALRAALSAERLEGTFEEIDLEAAAAPRWALGWGSPTILVDGEDIGGAHPVRSAALACRLYLDGAPRVDDIRRAIRAARQVRASEEPR